jgi:hypothetical protein
MYIQVSQEERSIFWEVTVSVILSKNVYMHICPILNDFWASARAIYHVLTGDAKGIDVDGGIFEKNIIQYKLNQLCYLNNKHRY